MQPVQEEKKLSSLANSVIHRLGEIVNIVSVEACHGYTAVLGLFRN